MPNTAERVRKLIANHLKQAGEAVIETALMRDDLGADSLEIIEIGISIEEEFDFEITDDDIETWKTVGDVVRGVEGRLQ